MTSFSASQRPLRLCVKNGANVIRSDFNAETQRTQRRRASTLRRLPAVCNLLIIVLSLSLVAGCNRSSSTTSQITVETEFTPQPARVGPLTINFKLKDAAGKPISGAHATLEGNMTHPGMAPALAEAAEVAPGNYHGNLELTMGGDWVVMIHLVLSDGQKLDRELELKGVRAD
jgi:hypothetical protein